MASSECGKPSVTEAMAVELADRLYGLTVVSIKPMVGFDDKNFHLQVSNEHRNPHIESIAEDGYNLKITRSGRSALKGYFDSMHSTMIHLHEKGLRTPQPVTNVEGHTWKLERVPLIDIEEAEWDNNLCGVHLLTFVPGVTVGSLNYTKDILQQWGRLLARFHYAVEDLKVQTLDTEKIFWNLEHVPLIKEFMIGLDDIRTELVLKILDRYSTEIEEKLPNVPKGIIHGDFNECNILAQTSADSGTYSVDGILDFEDVHRGTYVWDVGTLLAYSLLDCTSMDPLEGAGHALAGYTSLRPLSALELSMLKICIESRLCQSLVLCAHNYRMDPQNEYLMKSSKNGWTRLEQISKTADNALLSMWKSIEFKETAS